MQTVFPSHCPFTEAVFLQRSWPWVGMKGNSHSLFIFDSSLCMSPEPGLLLPMWSMNPKAPNQANTFIVNIYSLLDYSYVPLLFLLHSWKFPFLTSVVHLVSVSIPIHHLLLLKFWVFPFLKWTGVWENCHRFFYGKIRRIFSTNTYGTITMTFHPDCLPLQSLDSGLWTTLLAEIG